ncbi:MAG: hypothetical protein NTZ46_10870 [Verrucomicrobia bacterium]|nr:hypothetical protein [Verrucomicrobiota bacterium]
MLRPLLNIEKALIAGFFQPLSRFPVFARLYRNLEISISIGLIFLTLVFMCPILKGMATTSLSTDERGTVTRYSAKGPWKTVTCYDLAKNHIFFNLLNSITPGAKSLNSLRVRLWSYLFLGASGIAALIYFFRRGWYLEGALWFYFWGLNPELLMLNLSARGYGFLSLLTLALAILAIRYFETRSRRSLVALGLLTALGVWTIPSFLIFGATLLVFLFVATRGREVFIAGLATMMLIAVLYAPIVGQVLHVMKNYDGRYGQDYASIEAVTATLRLYLFPAGDNVLFVLLFGAFVAPFALWERGDSVGRGLRLLSGTVFVFFAACLTMKTPPLRTTALTVAPILFCLVHAFGVFFRDQRIAFMRPLLAVLVAIPLLTHASQRIAKFQFLPAENWMDAAHAIETIFPLGTTTHGGSNTLSSYLQKRYCDLDQFDKEAFLEGRSVVINNQINTAHGREVRVLDLSPRTLNLLIPQQIGAFQKLGFIPPEESGVLVVASAEGTVEKGWKITTPGILLLKVRPGIQYYSLNLMVKEGPGVEQVQAEALVNGTKYRMESFQAEGGRLYSLRLGQKIAADPEIRFSAPSPSAMVWVASIWLNPDPAGKARAQEQSRR